MMTLTWKTGDRVVTEEFSSYSIGLCPQEIQGKAAAEGAPVTLEIQSSLPALTVRHAVACMNVPVLRVILRTTREGQELTYVTDTTREDIFPGEDPGSSISGPRSILPTDLTIEASCEAPHSTITVECCVHTQQRESLAVHTRQVHRVPHSSSSVVIRGVSEGTSKTFVESIITIPAGVVGVKADQVHKHLLLDDGARAYSDPKLEVSNNDVSCSHGAAIRHCDEEQLFFLRSRGIDEQVARKVIVAAFLRQKIEIDGDTVSV